MMTCRYGASADGTPGEASPKVMTRHECSDASTASITSRRESTSPASSCPAPWALTSIRRLCISCAPADRRSARSERSVAWYAAASPGEIARTSIRLAPDPKLASNVGASSLSQAWACGDATITSAPGAPDAEDCSDSRRLDATPCAPSAVHMNGSHAMVSSLPTWPAIQAAACDRTVPTPPEDLADPLRGNWRWCALPDAGTGGPRGRTGEPDDDHHGRAHGEHADRDEQRLPRAAEAMQPPRRPQPDGRRQDRTPGRNPRWRLCGG